MNVLTNTLNLLQESISDAKHYVEQVELILKERNEKETSCQCKKEKKE